MTRVIDTYELSQTKASLLSHALSEGASSVDIEQVVAALDEPMGEVQFHRAWQRVVDRQSVLRSHLRWREVEAPVQGVADRFQIPIERFDWRVIGQTERHQRFQTLLRSARVRGFDLQRARSSCALRSCVPKIVNIGCRGRFNIFFWMVDRFLCSCGSFMPFTRLTNE